MEDAPLVRRMVAMGRPVAGFTDAIAPSPRSMYSTPSSGVTASAHRHAADVDGLSRLAAGGGYRRHRVRVGVVVPAFPQAAA